MSRYLIIIFLSFPFLLFSQNNFKGVVVSATTNLPLKNVEIHDEDLGFLSKTGLLHDIGKVPSF